LLNIDVFYENMVCINNGVNAKQKQIQYECDPMLSVNTILVFRTFLSESWYTLCFTLVL